MVGVSLLVPVGADGLLVADVTGRGDLLLPIGSVEDGHTPEQAAEHVLLGAPGGLSIFRQVAVDRVQTRRRQVITHIVATRCLTHEEAECLTYRDVRTTLCALPITQVIAELPERSRVRTLLGLRALAADETIYLEAGVARHTKPTDPAHRFVGIR
ncbi:hypothetical protein OH782_42215 (plasmid) [Streptomyces sp. NBC_01544]|uniref:hypothetical protein n=1 Tax=Streptomyces sp. NBC_01544 TaxID=2975871 RepID=UPI0038661C93